MLSSLLLRVLHGVILIHSLICSISRYFCVGVEFPVTSKFNIYGLFYRYLTLAFFLFLIPKTGFVQLHFLMILN